MNQPIMRKEKFECKQTPKRGSKSELTQKFQESSDPEEEESPSKYETPRVIPRRTARQIKIPDRYSPTICTVTNTEPSSYEEVMQLPELEKQKWLKALEREFVSETVKGI